MTTLLLQRTNVKLTLLFLSVLLCVSAARAQQGSPISDNSFLIEEAYNQEAGVVQHINTFMRQRNGDWAYTFTQEWPAPNMKHQLSYTVPGQSFGGVGRGFGDVLLNYRYQLISNNRLALSPRLSLILPTGNVDKSMSAGSVGYQLNIPLSVVHSKRLVTHWNPGATLTPRAKNAEGFRATTKDYNFAQSFVWLAHSRFNALLETGWNRNDEITGPRRTKAANELLVSPGVRWSHNFKSGLQIVPGVAVPLGVGPSRGQRGVFFYLSFEHPFKKIPAE